MSSEYLKLLDDVYFTLSSKLRCLIANNLNININFDHKLNEVYSSISNEQLEELNLKRLSQRLCELHAMLDMKMKSIEEVNLICTKQNKAYFDFHNDQSEAITNSQNISDTYSEIESVNCEMTQSKFKSADFGFPPLKIYEMKNPLSLNRSDSVSSKKLPSSRYSDDSGVNPATSSRNPIDCGPLLRKKLNFPPNKHKSKKFIAFKKQALFKTSKESSLKTTSDSVKYSSFSKKRKRLSLSRGSLLHGKRTRSQPGKPSRPPYKPSTSIGAVSGGGAAWDHEDSRAYCICNKPSYGDMIACDSERCAIEWFHYKCVDITTSPKGDWFCPMCKLH